MNLFVLLLMPSALASHVQLTDFTEECADDCLTMWINDGFCDRTCNVSSCDYDGDDCATSECFTHDGFDYRGTVDRTRTGKRCVVWSKLGIFEPGLGEHSFCRNYNGRKQPWCHTDVDNVSEWEYCNIPSTSNCNGGALSATDCAPGCDRNLLLNDVCDPACDSTQCMHDNGLCGLNMECFESPIGTDYRGRVSFTSSGRVCQRWDTQYPHHHQLSKGLAHNYCRNMDNSSGPWCYTTDPLIRWESCSAALINHAVSCDNRSFTSEQCPTQCLRLLHDDKCDDSCDTKACMWDGGDCEDMFNFIMTRTNVDLWRLRHARRATSEFLHANAVLILSGVFVGIGVTLVFQYVRLRKLEQGIRNGKYEPYQRRLEVCSEA